MMTILTIFLMVFLAPASVFADGGCEGMPTAGNQTLTLEGCFAAGGDPGSRSGCIMEVAAHEKDVILCDLIEIPGMVHDCINGVAAVATITPEKCKNMNEKFRGHCLSVAKQ